MIQPVPLKEFISQTHLSRGTRHKVMSCGVVSNSSKKPHNGEAHPWSSGSYGVPETNKALVFGILWDEKGRVQKMYKCKGVEIPPFELFVFMWHASGHTEIS